MRGLREQLSRVRHIVKVRRQELFELAAPGSIVHVTAKMHISIECVSYDNVGYAADFRDDTVVRRFRCFLDEGQWGVYATADSKVVGHAWAIVCRGRSRMANHYMKLQSGECLIHFCSVEPSCRGKNIYPAMLVALCRRLFEEAGVQRIVIDTEVDNVPALQSIRKVGFSPLGRRVYLQLGRLLVWQKPLPGGDAGAAIQQQQACRAGLGSGSVYTAEILRPQEIADEWDQLVDESPQGCIFCRIWWLTAVCPGQLRLLVVRKGHRLAAGMPLPLRRRGIWLTVTLPDLTQTPGVLLAPSQAERYEARLSNEMAVLRSLVDAIPKVDVFCTNTHYSFTNWLPFYWAGYTQTTRYTYAIEDVSDLDKVFRNLAPRIARQIRKARREGIQVENPRTLERFWT